LEDTEYGIDESEDLDVLNDEEDEDQSEEPESEMDEGFEEEF
jgi:hypothetical protein